MFKWCEKLEKDYSSFTKYTEILFKFLNELISKSVYYIRILSDFFIEQKDILRWNFQCGIESFFNKWI